MPGAVSSAATSAEERSVSDQTMPRYRHSSFHARELGLDKRATPPLGKVHFPQTAGFENEAPTRGALY
jgi:hypothetical protein